jgi:hypothetical protein
MEKLHASVVEWVLLKSYQNVEPSEACKDDHYHLYLDENNDTRLKQTSPWYIQIQGQMGICKVLWCDFVFFHKKGHCY